jgi:hypothetical protein
MPDLIYNVKFNIEDSQFQQESAGVKNYAKSVEGAKSEVAGLKSQLASASKQSKKFNKTSKETQGSTKRMNASFSTANQSLFSLSDGLQDAAQFQQGFGVGMRAIGNNVGFTAELLGNLNSRVKQHNTALQEQVAAGRLSTKAMEEQTKTMKGELIGALKGPGGLLIAINVVVTAVTIFSNQLQDNKKKAEKAADSISEYADAIRALRDLVTPDVTQLEGLVEEEAELERVIELVKERKKVEKDLSAIKATGTEGLPQETIDVLEGEKQLLEERLELVERKIKLSPIDIGERGLKELEKALEGIRTDIEDVKSSAAGFRVELGLIADETIVETGLAVTKFELGLKGSEQALRDQIKLTDVYINKYTALANSTRITAEEQNIYATLLQVLVRENEAAQKALDGTNKELNKQGDEYAELKTLLKALQIEENSTLEVTSAVREDVISQVIREITAVQTSTLALNEKVEKLDELLSILQELRDLGSDGIFQEIEEDIKSLSEGIEDDFSSKVDKQMEDANKARLQEFLDQQKMQKEVREQIARDEIKLEREKFNTKMDIARSATQSIAALGQALAGDSKAAAIAFLAIEQGLRVAQVSMNTTQTVSQLTQDAFAASSKARAAAGGIPGLADAMAANAAAPILAQIPLAKKSGAAAIAAILAQTIGRGASILSSGGGSSSGSSAGSGGSGGLSGGIEAGFSEADEPLAYNPRAGMRSGPNQRTIVNFNVDETGFAFKVQGADGVAGANTLNMTSSDA